MSVHINCDRCGQPTDGFFLNAKLTVHRGCFADIYSKVSPAAPPWDKQWHLCRFCFGSLRDWSKPRNSGENPVEGSERSNAC